MSTRVAVGGLLALYLFAGVGCIGLGGDSSMLVTGRVTVDNVVWDDGGSVLFQSDTTSEMAVLDTQGRFVVRVPAGTYRVAVEPLGGIPVERPNPKQGGILPRYMTPSTSGITVSVDPDHRDVALDLETT